MRNVCDNKNSLVNWCPFSSWPASRAWHSLLETWPTWSSDWRTQLQPDFLTILLVLFLSFLQDYSLFFFFFLKCFLPQHFLSPRFSAASTVFMNSFTFLSWNNPCAEDSHVFIFSSLYLIYGRPLCSTLLISLIWNEHFKPEHVLNQILFPSLPSHTLLCFKLLATPVLRLFKWYHLLCPFLFSHDTIWFFEKYFFWFCLKKTSRIWQCLTWPLFSGPRQHSIFSGSLQ